jgi:uncharacterized protein YfaP (DUF2135 family)
LKQTGYSQIHAMMVSNEPQMIDLRVQYNNGSWADYGHVVMAYSYTNGQFNIYDPNVPGSAPGTGLQVMPFNTTTNLGFKQVFKSGLTAGDALVFNIFRHINYRVFTPPNLFADLYSSAQTGFKDDTKFPKVVLTDPFTTPSGTTPADTDSDMMRNTDDSKAIISGTITGGGITVSSTLVYVAGVKYETNVVEGAFSIQVPLLPGDNEVIILATDANTYNKWAGWLKDFIKCKAAPAVFTVTLTWDQGSSDVDLHVLEPTVNGTVGEHVYYLHPNPGDESNHPYLDFDNTQGYGPEHYICAEGMSGRNGGPGEPLFGTYLIKVHYYADHSEAEVTQGITWHVEVRYLAFRDPGTLDEIWLTDEYSGYLGVANSGSAHSFSNVGPEWSSLMVFEYEAPNPADYGVPPPPLTVF